MKLLLMLFLFGMVGKAQEVNAQTQPPIGPKIYYFPIYNGVQLVEIDYFNHTSWYSGWKNESKSHKDIWYAEAVAYDQTNVYLLRNSNGVILKSYGRVYVNGLELLPPATAPTITHKERLQQQKSNVGKVDLTWQDANGYGYRYSETRIREQLTEMPEAPFDVYGMIDTMGNEVIPPDYFKISYLDGEYLAENSMGGFSVYDHSFKSLISQNYGAMRRLFSGVYVYYNEGAWIVNAKGRLLDRTKYKDVKSYEITDDLIYSIEKKSTQRCGVLSRKLKKVTPPKYSWVKPIANGYLGFDNTKKAAIINSKGKQLTGFDFNPYKVGYHDGYYMAETTIDNKTYWGIIDSVGDTLVPFKYQHLTHFEGNLAKAFLHNKWGLIDRNGNELTDIKYDYMGELKGKYILVQNSNRWGLINSKGEELLPPENIGVGCSSTDYVFYRNADNQWNLLNAKTKKKKQLPYDQVYCFDWEYTRVIKNKKYGLIDKNGKEVLKPEYDLIGDLKNNQMLVRKGDKYGIMNADLTWEKPLKFSSYSFNNGVLEVH